MLMAAPEEVQLLRFPFAEEGAGECRGWPRTTLPGVAMALELTQYHRRTPFLKHSVTLLPCSLPSLSKESMHIS